MNGGWRLALLLAATALRVSAQVEADPRLADLRITLLTPGPWSAAENEAFTQRVRLPVELRPAPAGPALPEVERMLAEARGLVSSNEAVRAGRLLWQAARARPEHAPAVHELAGYYQREGDTESAIGLLAHLGRQQAARRDAEALRATLLRLRDVAPPQRMRDLLSDPSLAIPPPPGG